jgi:dihydroxyacetone kinase-like protein
VSEALYQALLARFESLEGPLNKLDAATGDGDHGSTMLKGFKAATDNADDPAKAFRRAAGGASGSLFSVLVNALDQTVKGQSSLADALQSAADRIHLLGQGMPGDKTMLDALLPACEAKSMADAATAARAGAEATRAMSARRGRAKHVEGKGVGHVDAGAHSVAEILAVFATWQGASTAEDI